MVQSTISTLNQLFFSLDSRQTLSGASTSSLSFQGTTANGEAINNISRHQKRLQAAASAASIYQKSYVYPSPSSLVWSPGYTSLPQDPNEAQSLSRNLQNQFGIPDLAANLPSAHFPGGQFEAPGLNTNFGDGHNSNPNLSVEAVEAQKEIVKHQIELLHHQLQFLEKAPLPERKTDMAATEVSDCKGKAVASSSTTTRTNSLISETGEHGKAE